MKLKIDYNSPVILSLALLALGVLLIKLYLAPGIIQYFTVKGHFEFNSFAGIFGLISHIAGHANWNHLIGNFTLILLIGPILEEKYGSSKLLLMILVTALITGILNIVFTNNSLIGASGIAFMLIILSSFTNYHSGSIPLTFILIATIFLGKEFSDIFKDDHVSQFAHILGGACGGLFGFYWKR